MPRAAEEKGEVRASWKEEARGGKAVDGRKKEKGRGNKEKRKGRGEKNEKKGGGKQRRGMKKEQHKTY